MSWNTLPEHHRQLAETHLTKRQLRILQDKLNGHSNRQIATNLDLDESTIRYHYHRAIQKLARHIKEPT